MDMHDAKEEPIPMDREILVWAYNIEDPKWVIEKFTASGESDHSQPNESLYPYNISHWCELPKSPQA